METCKINLVFGPIKFGIRMCDFQQEDTNPAPLPGRAFRLALDNMISTRFDMAVFVGVLCFVKY